MAIIKKGGMYKIDFPNGKSYIGITNNDVHKRAESHFKTAYKNKCPNLIIYKAIRKYGREKCRITILLNSNNKPYLEKREMGAIYKYNTLHPSGYNLTTGGEGMKGLTNRSLRKMRAASIAYYSKRSSRKQASEFSIKGWSDPAIRKKFSDLMKAKRADPKSVYNSKECIDKTNKAIAKSKKDPKYIKRWRALNKRKEIKEKRLKATNIRWSAYYANNPKCGFKSEKKNRTRWSKTEDEMLIKLWNKGD